MKGVLRQCEAVLVANASKFGKLRIFLMAHWYNLVHLQAICVDELKAIGDLQQLAKELEYAALDCRAKAILLDKIIESSPNPSLIESTTTNHGAISNLDAFSNARASNIMDEIASSDLSNGVLIVQNKRIPIQKVYLAMFSKYFKAMFLGEFQEKNQDEVVLEEVDYTDILEILAIIYPCGYPITDENLKVILKMADRFIMPDILERCKKFLKCSQKIKRAQKLWLAQQYNFPDLQVKYARQYKNVEEVKKLKAGI
ncbi:BTB/POZ domain-containing protein [Ditylenchus destructor]|uniref:BTB/POZ domain-containing protein n=1 Tax=Ditylenchus destructor TaxID=166010 RepID=A0AAD4QX25_9BILA|nr:BTB/POZ domain-containing protein [Ditylenchus destructor]